MKRTLVALAVAGAFLAPAAAMADGSGIVLTGVIHGDIGFGQEKRSDGTKEYKRQANIGTFATRWEIDGTEDLGWSQAIFGLAIDQKFAGDNGSVNEFGVKSALCSGITCNNNNIGDVNNRNSFLGLTGGWGTLKIGQNEHQYEIQQIIQDPDPASESQYGTLTLMTGYGIPGLKGFTRRDPQSVWYTSPNFGGVTIDVAYITPAGRKVDTTFAQLSPQGFQLAAQWKAAFGLALYGAVAQYNDEAVDDKNQAIRFGAGYGTELFQVDVAAEQLKYKSNDGSTITFGGATGTEAKRTNFMVSGSVNFGQHHIRLAYNQAQKAKIGGTKVNDSGARLIYLGYGYTLSKRTELQAIYGKMDNKDNACFGVAACGNDSDRFGVGIRHTF